MMVLPHIYGGPAFPQTNDSWFEGMTLRDWFAGMIIGGVIDVFDLIAVGSDAAKAKKSIEMAQAAYALASAMLAERDKEEEK